MPKAVFATRQMLKTCAAALGLAIVLISSPGAAQPDVADAATADAGLEDLQQRLTDQIEEEEARNGPLSTELIAPLTMLARLYEANGDYPLTLATVERARQVIRVNFGLYSLDEAPLLQLLIRSQKALGGDEAAWNSEHELLELLARHPRDPRAVPIWRSMGDRRMDMLERYTAGEALPEIVLGCYYRGSYWRDRDSPIAPYLGRCGSGSRRTATYAILDEALDYYSDAIRVLLRNGEYTSTELAELETELIRTSHEYGNYQLGRQSLRRLLGYDVARSEPLLTRVQALIHIADWDIEFARRLDMFENYEDALDTYTQIYSVLELHGVARESIDELFAPELPVVLPSFLPNPLESAPTASGFIDVAFEITPHGRSDRVEVLTLSGDAGRADAKELTRIIKRASFRPRSTDGRFTESSRVVVRYYPDRTAD